ncbi:hypothetical protein B9Z55_027770 [Caenorhabditis nigoni]|nr:hypothetical protein B9Z55_027770 [Caenorhabditis nigoni]
MFFVFDFLGVRKKSKEADKKNNYKLLICLILSHLLTSIVAFLANALILGLSAEKTPKELVLTTELFMTISQIGAAFRPFIFLIVSTEYQKTVKSFFNITASRPSVVSIHPAFPAQHISENRNSSSGATSNTQVSN